MHATILPQVTPVPVFGNWREVDTKYDLLRANNAMGYLNDQATPPLGALRCPVDECVTGLWRYFRVSQEGQRRLVAQMGSQLLSEANDLKRPLEIAAAEMGVDLGFLNAFVDGEVEIEAAHGLMRNMSSTYPVALSDLLVESDDTLKGARFTTAAEGEATRRVLDRMDRNGERTPYYEYRDSAMSRLGPFRCHSTSLHPCICHA